MPNRVSALAEILKFVRMQIDRLIRHLKQKINQLNGAGSPQGTGLENAVNKPGNLLWIISVDATNGRNSVPGSVVTEGTPCFYTVQSRKELRAPALPHFKTSVNEAFKC